MCSKTTQTRHRNGNEDGTVWIYNYCRAIFESISESISEIFRRNYWLLQLITLASTCWLLKMKAQCSIEILRTTNPTTYGTSQRTWNLYYTYLYSHNRKLRKCLSKSLNYKTVYLITLFSLIRTNIKLYNHIWNWAFWGKQPSVLWETAFFNLQHVTKKEF